MYKKCVQVETESEFLFEINKVESIVDSMDNTHAVLSATATSNNKFYLKTAQKRQLIRNMSVCAI